MPGPRSHYGKRSKDREARELKQHMNVAATAGGGGVTDHGALTGLGDDDHANYVHLTAARNIVGQHTFSPATPLAPFALSANAQGQVVTGLRADELNKDVIAGNALTGGGTLTGDVTLNVAPGAGMKILSDAIAVDFTKDEDWDDMADAHLDWNVTTHGLDVNLSGYDFDGLDFSFLAGLGLTWNTDQIDHDAGDFGDLHTNYPEHDQVETITQEWTYQADIQLDADLDFVGSQAITTTLGSLSVNPADNLYIASSGSGYVRIANNTMVGATVEPTTPLEVRSSNNPQFRISYNVGEQADFYVGYQGSLDISTTGTNADMLLFPEGDLFLRVASYAELKRADNAGVAFVIRSAANNTRSLRFSTGATARWAIQTNFTVESGSDVGSDFDIRRYDDAGSALGVPLQIIRSTGYAQFENRVGIGVAPSYPLHIVSTTEPQVRVEHTLGVDYMTIGVGSTGNTTYESASGYHIFEKIDNTSVYLMLRTNAANSGSFRFFTATTARWIVGKDATAESGSNAGSDFSIERYTDAGAPIDKPLEIERSTGEITLVSDLQLAAHLDFTGAQSITTTADALSILPTSDLIITPGSGITKMTDELQFQGAGEISTTSGDLTLSPTGDLDLAPTGSLLFSTSLIPSATDTYDIGSSVKLWRTGYFSELQSLLFVENTIQVTGGWQIIAYNQGTAQEDIDGSETAIDLGIDETGTNGLEANDFILFRAYGQVEYMQIVSQSGGLGSTIWNVTRNVDTSGANTWPQGSVFAVLGYNGDGRIELVASQNDSPRVSLFAQGTSYNAQTEYFRFGNLRDSYAIGSVDTYGVGIGDYGSDSFFQVTAANGIEFFDNSSVRVGQLTGETWTIGQVDASHKHIEIDSDAITFYENTIVYGVLTGSQWIIGRYDAVGYNNIVVNGTDITFRRYTTPLGTLSGTTWTLGEAASERVVITSAAVQFLDSGNNILASMSGTAFGIGRAESTFNNVIINENAIYFRDYTTVLAQLSGQDWLLGRTGTYHQIGITTTALTFYDAGVELGSLTGAAWTIGRVITDSENIYITSGGIEFRSGNAGTVVQGSLSGSTWTLGLTTQEHISISSTAIEMKANATSTLGKWEGSTITLGDTTEASIVISVSGTGIAMTDINGTTLTTLSDGELTLGDVGTDYLFMDQTGITFYGASDAILATLYSDVWTLGAAASERVKITATAVQFVGADNVVYGSLSGSLWTLGGPTSERLEISSTTINLKTAGGTSILKLDGSTISIGDWAAANNEYMTISTSGIEMFSNAIKVIDISTNGDVIFGSPTANRGNMFYDYSAGRLNFRGGATGTTVMAYIDTTGAITASGGNLTIDDEGINIVIPSGYAIAQSINWIDGTKERATIAADGSATATYLNLFVDSTDTSGQKATARLTSYAYSQQQSRVEIKAAEATSTAQLTLHVNSGGTNDSWASLAGLSGVGEEFRGLVIGSGVSPAILSRGDGLLEVLGSAYFTNTVYIGNSENANARQTRGLTINTAGTDGEEFISVKASDVAHGCATVTETDTYFYIEKMKAGSGGADIMAIIDSGAAEQGQAMLLRGICGTAYTGKGNSSTGIVTVQGMNRNGTGVKAAPAAGNIFVVKGYLNAHFIVDENGHIWSRAHSSTGDNRVGDFNDHHDDMALLNGLRGSVQPAQVKLEERFNDFIDYAKPILESAGIISYNDDGNHFIAHSRLQMLTIDAIRQFYDKQMMTNEDIYAKLGVYKKALLDLGVNPQLLS